MTRTKHRKSENKANNNMSRQPPLPHGLPPRSAGPNGYNHRDADVYRPSPPDTYSNRGPSRYEAPPQMYQFGSRDTSYRPSYENQRARSPPRYDSRYDDRYAPGAGPRDDPRDLSNRPSSRPSYDGRSARNLDSHPAHDEGFPFRYDAPAGLDYSARQSAHIHSPPRKRAARMNETRRGGLNNHFRGRGGVKLAADREFLKTNREPTPELMTGMEADAIKYRSDVSDSEEADMDISDSDDDADEPKKKQARTGAKAPDGDSVPKWSNPDPYTALAPPAPDAQKTKDMVALIRKARVAPIQKTKATEAPDDFISFDFSSDEGEKGDDYHLPIVRGVEGAPTGPRPTPQNSSMTGRDIAHELRSSAPSGPAHRMAPDRYTPASDSQGSRPFQRMAPDRYVPAADDQKSRNALPQSNITKKKQTTIDLTSDDALGSRKRNSRDELKPPPVIHHRGKPGPAANGSIVQAWKGTDTPWIDMDHSDSAKLGIWLHKEIMDFYNHVKPTQYEHVVRTNLVNSLRSAIRQRFAADADLESFGSFPAGLYLPTADMDLVLLSQNFRRGGRPVFGQTNSQVRKFAQFITRERLCVPGTEEMIFGAKVPLVKYVDRLTGLKVDISFENNTGLVANQTFQDWKEEFPALPIIVTLVKHMLAMRGLNEPVNGGIGGFSTICLVVSLLQHMPQVQSRSMVPEHHLNEILMEFFDLYGNQFNSTTTAIQTKPPGYLQKSRLNIYSKGPPEKFCIMDPNTPDNDISGGSKNTKTIVRCFSDCYAALQQRMNNLQYSRNRRHQSILGCILGGNYSSFKLQRDHLEHVHEVLYGPISVDK